MNRDYRLLDRALETLQNIRPWVSADYYREHIRPLVEDIRDRLAAVDMERIMASKKKPLAEVKPAPPEDFSDTVPDPLFQEFKKTGFSSEYDPIVEATSNFGIFQNLGEGPRCSKHPRAPHRYLKELSENMGRYVCACEFWEP